MSLIKMKHLYFNYPTKKEALKNINLEIKEGTFNCIVGENGSRKDDFAEMYSGLKQRIYGRN